MVKDLNLQNGGEGSDFHTCNLIIPRFLAYVTYKTYFRWPRLGSLSRGCHVASQD